MYTIYDIDSFSKEEYLDFFNKLLLSNYGTEIENILAQPDPSLYYSIVVEFSMILEGDVNFGPLFLAEPRKLLPIFNEGLLIAQESVLKYIKDKGGNNFESYNNNNNIASSNQSNINMKQNVTKLDSSNFTVKKNCRVRVCDLPICKEINSSSLPKASDIGLFIEMRGTVIRTGQSKILEKSKFFSCSKCHHQFEVFIDFEQFSQFSIPKKCPNPDGYCAGTFFSPTKGIGDHCDFQEIKLQEQIHQLGAGSIPKSILLLLQEDLVDSCQAGDEITVSGVVIRRWKPIKSDERCDIEIVVIANYIRVMNEQKFATSMTDEIRNQFEDFWIKHENCPLVGRNTILSHICPGVYGLFVVRLALLLVLIGGVNVQKLRGECHMLLVGEPGTGKSQFLKYAARLASRSVITTGIGTTSAGLTASAVREPGGEMVLEAGALVLADGGVCCIDEFSGIKEADRATIHEAMEQQTLSIAKAGVISKLHTRTTIIAATNAKGKYDPSESLCVNTNLASPLLSRFDVILLLTDNQDTQWDTLVSEFILKQSTSNFNGTQVNAENKNEASNDIWNLDMLQSYIYYVKATFTPKLTPESQQLLEVYYQRQRASGTNKNEGRTTVRLLQSLIRLSQAHARLMFRNVVEVQDAIIAIFMIESSVESNCIFSNLNAQHSLFPDDPDAYYKNLEKRIKEALGLREISHKSLPRNRSKPKPTNHKINDNWVNNNHDDEDDNDNDEYVEVDENENEEQLYDVGIDVDDFQEHQTDWEEQRQYEEVHNSHNWKQQRQQNEEFEYIETQSPINKSSTIRQNSNIQLSSHDNIIIEDTPLQSQNNIKTPITQNSIINSTIKRNNSTNNNNLNNNNNNFSSNSKFSNSNNITTTQINQYNNISTNKKNIQNPPINNNLFNDDDLFSNLDDDDINNNEPMDTSKSDDKSDDEFQLSHPRQSQTQAKSNSNNTSNDSNNKFTQENENFDELVDEILDDGMDWDDDNDNDPQPTLSKQHSSNIANPNISIMPKSSSISKTNDDNEIPDLEWD